MLVLAWEFTSTKIHLYFFSEYLLVINVTVLNSVLFIFWFLLHNFSMLTLLFVLIQDLLLPKFTVIF